jgi:hypothetical protein
VTRIDVTPLSATLAPGERAAFQATARDAGGQVIAGAPVTWQSSAPLVASVSSDGVVLASGPGTVELRVRSGNSSAAAVVTVSRAAPKPTATVLTTASISIDPPATALSVGGTVRLQAVVRDQLGNLRTGRPIRWSVTDPGVLRVSGEGVVTAVGAGSARVELEVDGRTAAATIAVAPAPVAALEVAPTRVIVPETAAAPRAVDPRPDVERSIETYRRAIESRDLAKLRAAYPGLTTEQERAWRSFYSSASELTAAFRIQDLQISGDHATARVAATYDFRAGRRQTQNLDLTMTLERGPAGWRLATLK